jgi:hypothetical protein
MIKRVIILFIFFALLIMFNNELIAQCPMCKMAAEANMKDGGTAGKGLNTGILYLLAMPYLLVFTLAFLYKRNKRRVGN